MAAADSLAAYTGVDLDLVARAIAGAICKSAKFGSAEHKAAMGTIIAESSRENLASNLERIGNVSQVRQELEKAGLVSANPSALMIKVREEVDRIESATAKKPTP